MCGSIETTLDMCEMDRMLERGVAINRVAAICVRKTTTEIMGGPHHKNEECEIEENDKMEQCREVKKNVLRGAR